MSNVKIKDAYGFIYMTTNLCNGKRYIGQKKFDGKWKHYLGSGKTLKKALNKYGKENFIRDIVSIAYSKEELDKLEIEWIKNYNAVESDDFYNIAFGGLGGYAKGNTEKIQRTQINNDNTRKIYKLDKDTYEIIKQYDSISSATKELTLSRSIIKNVLSPKYSSLTAGGFAWKYIDEENIKYNDDYKKNKINNKKKSEYKKRDEILDLYDKEFSINEINKLGYVKSTIRDAVQKYRGYNVKKMLSNEEILIRNEEIIDLYLKGYRNCEIEKELKLSRSVVQKAIYHYKLE